MKTFNVTASTVPCKKGNKDARLPVGTYEVSCPQDGMLLFVNERGRFKVLHNNYRRGVNRGEINEYY